MTPAVEVVDLCKRYGAVEALRPVSFSIRAGTYFVLLGPSGGGKTTTLRLLGGLTRATGGRIKLSGEDVTDVPPNKRNTSMVFQSYALFPHMNVMDNVSYGLKLRKMARTEIAREVDEMLELVGLSGYGERLPHELSGGQQQRVQLARSLVLKTDIVLLDEPLAALDAKLRKSMCLELKSIQKTVGITFVHVTHNQEEAMTVADEIALIADGELVEQGDARAVYEKPKRRFTAQFIGENTVLAGTVAAATDSYTELNVGDAKVRVANREDVARASVGENAWVSIRSELAQIVGDNAASGLDQQAVPIEFVEQIYLGFSTTQVAKLPDGQAAVSRALSPSSERGLRPGDTGHFVWPTAAGRLHLN